MKYLARALVLAAFFLPSAAFAATLSVTPGSASVSTGNIVTVRIVTNTAGTAVNEADGTLQFPSDLLDVVSVSKSGSIFSLWVEDPSFSNAAGTVSFDGGLPNPGYTGSGTVLTVTFHAKRAGVATLSFADASVRANDGFGTDVLSGSNGGQVTIANAPPAAPTTSTPKPSNTLPAQPTGSAAIQGLTSSTHPDQSLWYASTNPTLSWTLPEGATAVETILGDSSDTIPSVVYKPAIREKQLTGADDGISYFNIRAQVGGAWGPISSYRLQVDTKAPTLGNAAFSYDLLHHEVIVSNITATDTGSGVAKFELVVDNGTPQLIQLSDIVNGTYSYSYRTEGDDALLGAAGASTGGTHTAVLTVFDQAGNRASATGAFVVPLALIDQSLLKLFGINITLLWFIIAILLLTVGAIAAAAAAWWRLFILRQSSRTKVAKREQVVHRALTMFRTDLERHIKTLEHTSTSRKLTEEEEGLRTDLTDNLTDLERYLKKEFKKFD